MCVYATFKEITFDYCYVVVLVLSNADLNLGFPTNYAYEHDDPYFILQSYTRLRQA